jgi:ABC-type sugar transport system ATPase subunit
VLDEVSSSIDVATDKFIQRVVREEFAGATIISVAHRLDTILDFDRIALLSNGDWWSLSRLGVCGVDRVLLGTCTILNMVQNGRYWVLRACGRKGSC